VVENDSKITSASKGLFVALMAVTCILIAGAFVVISWLQGAGLASLHPRLPAIAGGFLVFIAACILLGTLLLVSTTLLGKDILGTRFLRGAAIKFLLPVIELIGRLVGIPRDTIRQSFIAMNNSLVLSQQAKMTPDRILILLPPLSTAFRLRYQGYRGDQQMPPLRPLSHLRPCRSGGEISDRYFSGNRRNPGTQGHQGKEAQAGAGRSLRG